MIVSLPLKTAITTRKPHITGTNHSTNSIHHNAHTVAESHTREYCPATVPDRPPVHTAPKRGNTKQSAVLAPILSVNSQKKQTTLQMMTTYEFLGCINSVDDMTGGQLKSSWMANQLALNLIREHQSEKAWRNQRNSNLQRNPSEDQVTLLSTSWVSSLPHSPTRVQQVRRRYLCWQTSTVAFPAVLPAQDCDW